MRALGAVLAAALLASCSTSEVQTAQTDLATASSVLQGACATALAASSVASGSLKGGAANTMSNVVSGVVAGCTTAEGIAKLAADPSSTEWLGIQTGTLRAAVAVAS